VEKSRRFEGEGEEKEKKEDEKLPEEAMPSDPTEILKQFEDAFETLEKEKEGKEGLPTDTATIAEILKEMKGGDIEIEEKKEEQEGVVASQEEHKESEEKVMPSVEAPTVEVTAGKETAPVGEAIYEMPTVESKPPAAMPPSEVSAASESVAPIASAEAPTIEAPSARIPDRVGTVGGEISAVTDEKSILSGLENLAPVETVQQLPPGAKYRRVTKDELVRFVKGLVETIGRGEMDRLLAQMTEREMRIKALEDSLKEKEKEKDEELKRKEGEIERLKTQMEELEKQASDIGGVRERWLAKEEEYIARIKENEEKIAGLENALKAEDLRERLKQLEEEVILLRGKVQELQKGFEYVGFVEEFDVGAGLLSAAELQSKLEGLLSGVGEHTQAFIPSKVREKLEFITQKASLMEEQLQAERKVYSELIGKMEEGNGSIAVVVDIASLAAQMKGLTEQLHLCHHILELVEAVIK